MKQTEYGYTFESTGREIYSNCHYLGINPEFKLSEGFDGCPEPFEEPFTSAERIELADFMIALWDKYKRGEVGA